MSFFGSLFGKAPAPAPVHAPAPAAPTEAAISAQTREAIANLNQKRDMVQKRQQLLEARQAKCLEEAKQKMAKSDKKGAMLALKRKKLFEAEAAKYDGAIVNLERQVMMLEGAAMDASVLSGYKQSAGMIKNIQKVMNVEDVDEVMDDLAEAMDIGRDVSEAIGREIGPSVAEDDVEAEFEAMCAEAAESDFLAAPAVPAAAEPVLPDLPAGLPALPVPARAAAAAPARVAVAVGAPAPAARPRPAAPVDADLAALEAEFN